MSQPSHPTLINLPQPPSNPDTPEIPGTPTSTTTSLSALSTTAIKDGHRGALNYRGHQHSLSTNSLEAERADRISRLPGLGTVSARGPPGYNFGGGPSGGSPQITPTSTGFPIPQAGRPPPPAVYFDAAGQPTAATKMSTVGTASATEESSSVSGRSRTTTLAGGGGLEDLDGDHDMLTEMDSASASGYVDADAMDEDLASRSVGTFEGDLDRNMSDDEDGNASLVGFGEGAGSTVSGPIYHRRGNIGNLAQQQQTSNTSSSWKNFERSNSGLSETATPATASTARRDAAARLSERERERTTASDRESGDNTPASVNALRERREARMVDGIALSPGSANVGITSAGVVQVSDNNLDDDIFVDTTTSGPVPVQTAQHQHPTSAIRETQQPGSHQHVAQQQQQHAAGLQQARARVQQQQQQQQDATSTTAGQRGQTLLSSAAAGSVASSTGTGTASREAAERIIREQMDTGAVGNTALGSPPAGGEGLGRFYFEKR